MSMPSEPEINALRRQVASLEREVGSLAREAGKRDAPTHGESRTVRDVRWSCSKCNTLLAWWDPDKDVLRIRYKDHQVFARAGGVDPSKIVESVLEALSEAGVAADPELAVSIAGRVAEEAVLGFVQVICRGCGEVNTVEYVPQAGEQGGRAL